MKHDLVEKEGGFLTCQSCKRIWKRKPTGECQGYPEYSYGQAPKNLLTEGQLARKRLNPGPTVRGSVTGYKLYDLTEAIPYSEEQLADLRAKQRAARYKICRRCQKTVSRKKWQSDYGMCDDCVPEHDREVSERKAREYREYQEQLAKEQAARRDKSIIWARDLVAKGDALILDTETTGLDWTSEIVSIGIIDMQGTTMLSSLVRPSQPIPDNATRIHGITDEMVAGANGFAWIYGFLVHLLAGRLVISYNISFDGMMLSNELRKMGILATDLLDNSACAMLAYADYCGEWSEYWGNNKWQPLPGGDHSALGDCLATLKIIQEMAAAKLSTEAIDENEG